MGHITKYMTREYDNGKRYLWLICSEGQYKSIDECNKQEWDEFDKTGKSYCKYCKRVVKFTEVHMTNMDDYRGWVGCGGGDHKRPQD